MVSAGSKHAVLMCPTRFHSPTASAVSLRSVIILRVVWPPPSTPAGMPFFAAKIPLTKCGCKQNTESPTVEQGEAHSVTGAGSVLSQGYEQLPRMFRKGMPMLI